MIPLSLCEQHLCSFVSWLADEGLKYRTTKIYLSAVRHLQIKDYLPNPFTGKPMARLEYITRGIKKQKAEAGRGERPRLPITPAILYNVEGSVGQNRRLT